MKYLNPTKKPWLKSILQKSAKIRDAVKSLEQSSIQVVIIIDDSNKIEGIITDGDLRRAFLKGLNLEDKIEYFINYNPITVKDNDPQKLILDKFNKHQIKQIPIVDNKNKLLGVYLLEEYLDLQNKENPIVIMAGGFGKRLKPLTNDCPKPMLKVLGKPILQHIIENAVSQGFYNFFITTYYLADVIKQYFEDGSRFGAKITYVDEKTPLGTAGSLKFITKTSNNQPIIVTNADIITEASYSDILEFHNINNSFATMAVRQHEWQNPFGVVRISGKDIIGFKEKPITREYVNAGFYVLNPMALSYIPKDKVFDMPSLFEVLRAEEKRIIAFPIYEDWIDVGRPNDLETANEVKNIFLK